jgi:hypothetical protein
MVVAMVVVLEVAMVEVPVVEVPVVAMAVVAMVEVVMVDMATFRFRRQNRFLLPQSRYCRRRRVCQVAKEEVAKEVVAKEVVAKEVVAKEVVAKRVVAMVVVAMEEVVMEEVEMEEVKMEEVVAEKKVAERGEAMVSEVGLEWGKGQEKRAERAAGPCSKQDGSTTRHCRLRDSRTTASIRRWWTRNRCSSAGSPHPAPRRSSSKQTGLGANRYSAS